ncbi:MAG: UDP-N-acetylmuramate dehydrogenase [Lachnospiraceae bacterium]|nr:UDP-N-acetylmuramate dehydrogenase [Lachnospiraceae bacterium]
MNRILEQEPMKLHTTFRVGGPAKLFLRVESEAELQQILALMKTEGEDYYLIGNGSNLLISDKGYDGVMIQLSKGFADVKVDGRRLYCEAGATLSAIARVALEHSLTGFEFAAGIPGSLGGAIVMNAGAYGGEMKQVVEAVRLMDAEGNIIEKSCEEMHFGYRHSILKEASYIVLGATIRLEAGEHAKIKEQMDALASQRREKQPLEYPSAGSTFKRPEGYFAGKLIQDAGLRGFQVGGAQVSEKHCGFVINKEQATASEIFNLIQEVRQRVANEFGVTLETEVICLGEF